MSSTLRCLCFLLFQRLLHKTSLVEFSWVDLSKIRDLFPTMADFKRQPSNVPYEMPEKGLPQGQVPFRTEYACISFNQSDKVRFVGFDSGYLSLIDDVVQRNWPKGIQRAGPYNVAHEIKLRGNPWSVSTTDRFDAINLVRMLLEALFNVSLAYLRLPSTAACSPGV